MSALSPLSGDKQTFGEWAENDAIDPERTSCHGAKAGICIRLSLVVTHPRERKCGDAVEANNR
jgi:hypothetical protein